MDEYKEKEVLSEGKTALSEAVDDTIIKNLIHIIRGKQVMLDSDLAMLYQVETKVLNQSVKRNINRFPDDFCFRLTEEEYEELRSQYVTSKGGRRYLPYAFTEQGIAMLSGILRSDVAIKVSIGIMRAFVEMRRFLSSNALIFERINEMEFKQLEYQKNTDEKFDEIFDYISGHEEVRQKIFFDGQIFDAFSFLVGLVEKAEKSIILADNYVDVDTLNILAKKREKVSACIYTMKKTKLTSRDIEKFNKQYPLLEVKYTGVFHDRFMIIDEKAAYHIGASIKDAGKRCFGVSLLEDKRIIQDILERMKLETEEQRDEEIISIRDENINLK